MTEWTHVYNSHSFQLGLGLEEKKAFARNTDPETSHQAAAKVNASRLEEIVMDALTHGPMTSKELAEATGEARVSVSPRFKPLERRGLIVRTDERRDGCVVWKLSAVPRST